MIAFIVSPLALSSIHKDRFPFVQSRHWQPAHVHHSVVRRRVLCAELQSTSNVSARDTRLNPAWEKLSVPEFDELLTAKRLPLCLVGMSNCGKSHWSEQLQNVHDFGCVCIDDEIEDAIKPELEELGYSGIADMAKWMGYPSDERFAANEKRYLELEERITSQVVPPLSSNFVLDTTGSVVYLSAATRKHLRSNFLVVHLAATNDMLEQMRVSYFESPKPVVWGDSYSQSPDESPMEALRRCYDGLLSERLKRYYSLAHVSVPAATVTSPDVDVNQFLDFLRDQLDRQS